jgi:hypothetical protein
LRTMPRCSSPEPGSLGRPSRETVELAIASAEASSASERPKRAAHPRSWERKPAFGCAMLRRSLA